MTAAIWSAIAASCSAVTALIALRIQRRNLLEAARSEIILDGWTGDRVTAGKDAIDTLSFHKIRNVGKGLALTVVINASKVNEKNLPLTSMSTRRLAVLPIGEASEHGGDIKLWFKNVEANDGVKYLPVEIVIVCWDIRKRRHVTRYQLMANDGPQNTTGEIIARGDMVPIRTTKDRAVWWLRFLATMRKAHLLGRWVGKDVSL